MPLEYDPDNHDEYATPASIWRPLSRAVDGFDLDPASGAESQPIADSRYTKEDNGLEQSWHGDVWLNPPFSDKSGGAKGQKAKWLEKALQEVQREGVRSITILLPVDTSTNWFHNLVLEAEYVCFLDYRPEFEGHSHNESGNTSFPVMIAAFGNPPQQIEEVLEEFGAVFQTRSYFRSTVQTKLGNAP